MAEAFEPVPPGVPRLDFVVPGFAKSGSTSLCAMLALHPRVFIPGAKELWFFSMPAYRDRWGEFAAHFDHAPVGTLLGEGSTAYLGSSAGEAAARAIARHYPDCRILIVARDPLDRVLSSVREMHHSGHLFGVECPFDLREALESMPHFLADALYWERSAPWRELFPPAQVHVVFFEDMCADPAGVLQGCYEHLALDPAEAPVPGAGLHLNTGETKLRDTRALRWLRRRAGLGVWLAARDDVARERWLRCLRLRRRIGPVAWPPGLREELRERLGPDAKRFLRHYGKPEDFWPGVAPRGPAQPPLARPPRGL